MRRLLSVGAAAVAALLVFTAACGGDGDGGSASTPTAPTTVAAGPTSTAGSDGSTGASVVVVEVSVRNGAVSGVDSPVEVELGQHVRITVDADVADEVHVHGYDERADVAPGVPATIELDPDLGGVWEVELEGSHLVLFELQVS